MNANITLRREDTLASIKAEQERAADERALADAVAAEEARIARKRQLLASVLAMSADVDAAYEDVKLVKRTLKDLRADIKSVQDVDLDIADLEDLIRRGLAIFGAPNQPSDAEVIGDIVSQLAQQGFKTSVFRVA